MDRQTLATRGKHLTSFQELKNLLVKYLIIGLAVSVTFLGCDDEQEPICHSEIE
jgi:hypothetical protein